MNGWSKSGGNFLSARSASRIALWTAAGVVIGALERMIPSPVPWIKLGMANGAALIALYAMGWRAALTVNMLRAAAIAAIFGSWASPAFVLSIGGGVAAVATMAAVKSLAGGLVSPIGVSAAGAFAHMLVQFSLAAMLIVRHAGLLAITGPSLIAAVIAGVFVGWIGLSVITRLPRSLVYMGQDALDKLDY